MIKGGIKVIAARTAEGIRTNCTLIFNAGQAISAVKAGATNVSPVSGRLDGTCTDGLISIEHVASAITMLLKQEYQLL